MSSAALTTTQQNSLLQADRATVSADIGSLRSHFGQKLWLRNGNTYELDCIKALDRDTLPGKSIHHDDLREYIAASVPLHCVDGWSFLGRAIDAHSRGDFDAARHLGYYAELRAAMSLLASEGIGIFSTRHFIVHAGKQCKRVEKLGGTHAAIWPTLEYWAEQPRAADLLGTVIQAGGYNLRDWLSAFDTSGSLRPIARQWLQNWGFDLHYVSEDREARNVASYRPTRLTARQSAQPAPVLDFLAAFWDAYAPQAASRFEMIDRHLVRMSLEAAHRGRFNKEPAADRARFTRQVTMAVAKLAPTGPTASDWISFLTRAEIPSTHAILSFASGSSSVRGSNHHVEVCCRASLLLRVAAGACAKAFADNSVVRSDVDFWWSEFGEDRGLWDPGNEPAAFIDMMADIESALEDLSAWRLTNGNGISFLAMWNEQSKQIAQLGRSERIALWGLGL